ncbi:hypothetical protein [Marinifilum flexuosum]|nr:hypothetical protein [Marinifilum flexuosum]
MVSEFNVKDGCVNGQSMHVNVLGMNVSVSVVDVRQCKLDVNALK